MHSRRGPSPKLQQWSAVHRWSLQSSSLCSWSRAGCSGQSSGARFYTAPSRSCAHGAWSAHLTFAARIKRRLGMDDVSSHAFNVFTTLLSLVFSVLLGQTFSYSFARQGAIQEAAFRKISEMQRLLELCLHFTRTRKRRRRSAISSSCLKWRPRALLRVEMALPLMHGSSRSDARFMESWCS